MKTHTTLILILILFASCKKQSDDVFKVLQNSEHFELKQITQAEIENASTGNYTINDVLGLISEFGQTEPDIIPAWNGFVQGQGCNNTHWDYIGATCDSVIWLLHDDAVRDDISLWFYSPVSGCGYYDPPCNGGHEVTVRCYLNGTIYERSAVSWALINYPGKPSCELGIFNLTPSGLFEAGVPLVFEPYQFLTQTRFQYDLDGNHTVNINDLFELLAQL